MDSIFVLAASTANSSAFYPFTPSCSPKILSSETTESNFEQIIFDANDIEVPNSRVQWVPSASLGELNPSVGPQLHVIALESNSVPSDHRTHRRHRDRPKKGENVLATWKRKEMRKESAAESRKRLNAQIDILWDSVPTSYQAGRCMANKVHKVTRIEKIEIAIKYVNEMQKLAGKLSAMVD